MHFDPERDVKELHNRLAGNFIMKKREKNKTKPQALTP